MEKLTLETKEIMKERFGKDENKGIAEKLRKAFCEWIDNGQIKQLY